MIVFAKYAKFGFPDIFYFLLNATNRDRMPPYLDTIKKKQKLEVLGGKSPITSALGTACEAVLLAAGCTR